jgi:N-acetylglucosaminyldiphosphoundecaprenol N-acetyl-beta-D-mannosaminyltransferase
MDRTENHATSPDGPPTTEVLGYRIARCTLEEAAAWALGAARQSGTPKLLVTLNPEIVVQAKADHELRTALQHAALTVADGVGITWAAKRSGAPLPARVPGVELMTRILERAGPGLRVYFLACATRGRRTGRQTGARALRYSRRRSTARLLPASGRRSGGDSEYLSEWRAPTLGRARRGQELFLHTHRAALRVPLMMGVGGALDVLSGSVKRTPAWTHRLGLEWAYRVGFDRRRWHRIPRLARFVRLVVDNTIVGKTVAEVPPGPARQLQHTLSFGSRSGRLKAVFQMFSETKAQLHKTGLRSGNSVEDRQAQPLLVTAPSLSSGCPAG